MWYLCMTVGEDMVITGTTDIIMTRGEGDMTITRMAGITMTGAMEAVTGTGTADRAMTFVSHKGNYYDNAPMESFW